MQDPCSASQKKKCGVTVLRYEFPETELKKK